MINFCFFPLVSFLELIDYIFLDFVSLIMSSVTRVSSIRECSIALNSKISFNW